MRITLVNTLYPPLAFGGAERSVSELAQDLSQSSSDEVHVVTLVPVDAAASRSSRNLDSPVVHEIHASSVDPFIPNAKMRSPVSRIAWHSREFWRPKVLASVGRVIDETQPDVVHTNLISGIGPLLWKRARPAAVVHTLRDHYLICGKASLYKAGSNCTSRCLQCRAWTAPFQLGGKPDIFVGVSSDIIEAHRDCGYIQSTDQTRVVFNSPKLQSRAAVRRPNAGETVIGFIGKVADYKGIWVLLEAFERIADPTVRLKIAGRATASDYARIQEFTRRDSRISQVGPTESSSFYASVDIVAVPSQWREPFGRVAAEAALSGKHAVVSGIGGLPEAIADFPSCRVVEQFCDSAAWARALQEQIRIVASTRESPIPSSVIPTTNERLQPSDQYRAIYDEAIAIRRSTSV